MKLAGFASVFTIISTLFCLYADSASAQMPTPTQTGPSASAGADILDVYSPWGKYPLVYNEVTLGEANALGQGNPYVYIAVKGGEESELALVDVKSTVVFYQTYNGAPANLVYSGRFFVDDSLAQGDQTKQGATSSISQDVVGISGDAGMGNPLLLPHHYARTQYWEFTEPAAKDKIRFEVDFFLTARAHNN